MFAGGLAHQRTVTTLDLPVCLVVPEGYLGGGSDDDGDDGDDDQDDGDDDNDDDDEWRCVRARWALQ